MQIKFPIQSLAVLAAAFLLLPVSASADVADFLAASEIHAWAEAGYLGNVTGDDDNAIRVFDAEDNAFSAEGEIVVLKDSNDIWDPGYRIDLHVGSDLPEAITAAGSGGSDDVDFEQAYVTSWVPFFDEQVELTVGKFVTHMGWEVIQGYDSLNDNISRSINFGFAIPFTHTGLKATYEINDMATFTVIGTNGWDNVDDNNDAKTIGTQLICTPMDNLTVYVNGIYGAEQDNDNSDWRYVANLILEYAHNDQWTFVIDGTYGHEEDVETVVAANAIIATTIGGVTALDAATVNVVVAEDDADWGALTGYARYQHNDWLAFIVRSEFFIDEDGARTGIDQDLWEITTTVEAKINDNARVRFEGRYDHSNEKFFENGTDDSQFTLALNAQVWF